MKIAVAGKGGSGKTTVCAGLAYIFSEEDKEVIAVDCDPDTNLGLALGFESPEKIVPVAKMKELIMQRTGVESLEAPSTFFKINPEVSDIPDKFSQKINPVRTNALFKDRATSNGAGIRLLVMGKVEKASGGCMCPENTFMKTLISHLVLGTKQVVILDMVAGTEHLGRGTAKAVDTFLIVVEPTQLSLGTALKAYQFVEELKVKNIFFVGNKIQKKEDKEYLNMNLKNDIIGFIPYSKSLQDNRGKFVFDNHLYEEFRSIYAKINSKS